MKHIIQKAALAAFAAAAMVPANALVIGTADSANGIPFGSSAYLGGYYYQQVYSAASFGAGLDISRISFYNSNTPGGTPATGTFKIYLSTTSTAVSDVDSSGVTFPNGSFQEVFNGLLPAISNGSLDFDLSSAFHYDASAGNLMLTVLNFDLTSGNQLFLDADMNNNATDSRFSAYNYALKQGLVTGFNDVAQVPLPAGLPLLFSGMGALGAMLRRRRAG